MKLSAPIYQLKTKAKKLKKERGIQLTEALNLVAREEGFNNWSLLMSKEEQILPTHYGEILDYLNPGDVILVGARPGIGKTNFTMGLFVQGLKEKRSKSFYFSLESTFKGLVSRVNSFDESIGQDDELFELNDSDEICSEYIISRAKESVSSGSVIVIDYLQLLDQKRTNPVVQDQINDLVEFAKQTGAIIICISQIDRKLENKTSKRPTLDDVRLVNPLDIKCFNKILFLYKEDMSNGSVEVYGEKPAKFSFMVSSADLGLTSKYLRP
jgi:replicative DNA helicase